MSLVYSVPGSLSDEGLLSESLYDETYDPGISWPRITIVTPSYNQGKYIETTIRSILLQGYPNLQYIIIDGGSSDNTKEVIKYYEKGITYWVSEKDSGQSEAINKGIKIADGEVFNWINSDDWLEPGALKHIAELFLNNDAQAVATRSNIIKGGKLEYVNSHTRKFESAIQSALVTGLNQQGLFFKTECIKKLNGVDEIYHYSMDLDLWVRFLLTFGQDRMIISDRITSDFRFHEDCKSQLEGWGPGSASDKETKAMRIRIASILNNKKTIKTLKVLHPDYRSDIVECPPHSKINVKTAGKWINQYLYGLTKKAFYEEDFSLTKTLSKGIDVEFLSEEEKKNTKAFKKYAYLYGSFLGSIFKKNN